MRDYTFEYTRPGFTYCLFGISFAILIVGILPYRLFFKDNISPGIATAVLIGAGITFFFLNKHRIKRTGAATLFANDLTVELNEVTRIQFNELRYYYIHEGKNGPVITLGRLDGAKIRIEANNNFCNDSFLKVFLSDLQLAIEDYKVKNGVDIVQLETVFARKNAVYVLSIVTVLVLAGFCFMQMPLMILPIGISLSLLVGWIRYFQQRSNGKLVDF
jgi:uncharacterized membrane protein